MRSRPLRHLPVDPLDEQSHLSLEFFVDIDAGLVVMDQVMGAHGGLR
jgi:hypothetical protein